LERRRPAALGSQLSRALAVFVGEFLISIDAETVRPWDKTSGGQAVRWGRSEGPLAMMRWIFLEDTLQALRAMLLFLPLAALGLLIVLFFL
jgi:hypothetical protein